MLAGTLRAAGVYFGDVLDRAINFNPKGLHEAPSVLFMQEDLLVKNGGAWHEPPSNVQWERLHMAVRDLFIESRASKDVWAFKDPRTLLTLEGWVEAMPGIEFAGIFRHPAEVATSIQKRNNFDLQKCFDIWCVYNQKLLETFQVKRFPIIEFVADAALMKVSLTRMFASLDITYSEKASEFFATEHKHIQGPDIVVPKDAESLYRKLKAVAL